MDSKVRQSWEEFLDPDMLRPRLIRAAIYIAGYEALKDAIIDRLREFFTTGFDASGLKIDPKYDSDVLSRNKNVLLASLDWLEEMRVIDDADIEAFNRVKSCRNMLAHRLLTAIGSDGMPVNLEPCFHAMIALLRKIEVWWIKEVEIPTIDDFDGQEIDEGEIMPGRVISLQLLRDIALGDEENSRSYLDEFRKRIGDV